MMHYYNNLEIIGNVVMAIIECTCMYDSSASGTASQDQCLTFFLLMETPL